MASFTWDNSVADRDGTNQDNWTPQSPVGGPEAGDTIVYDGTEAGATPLDGDQLPTTMPSVEFLQVQVAAAYTLAAGVAGDLTDFTGGNAACTWLDFLIAAVTLQTPNGAEILSGGELTGAASGVLDTGSPVTTAGNCTIDWESGNLDILGGIAAAHTITHTNTTGSSLTCDVAGSLNLGATADTGIAIDIVANVALTAHLYCGNFTRTSGALSGAYTIIASGNVDLDAGTGQPPVTMTGTSTITADTFGAGAALLTVAAGATVTRINDKVRVLELVVEAGGTLNGAEDIQVYASVAAPNNSCAGVISGGALEFIAGQTHRINTGTFTGLTCPVRVISGGPDRDFRNIGSFITTGALAVRNTHAGKVTGFRVNGHLGCGAVTLGYSTGALDLSGSLTVVGSANISDIDQGNEANTANQLVIGTSNLTLTGTLTGTLGARVLDCDNTSGFIVGGTVTDAVFDNNIDHFVIAAVDSGNTKVTEIIGTPGTWMPMGRSMQVRNYDKSLQLRSW